MNIGLDYDDTFTADEQLWELFVGLAKSRGHDVRFVTFRFEHPNGYSNDDLLAHARRLDIPVIFCNGIQKDTVTKSIRFPVDIWIDDFPVGIPVKEHLLNMAEGVRVNDDKKRTTLASPVYSEEPLQIGVQHD